MTQAYVKDSVDFDESDILQRSCYIMVYNQYLVCLCNIKALKMYDRGTKVDLMKKELDKFQCE